MSLFGVPYPPCPGSVSSDASLRTRGQTPPGRPGADTSLAISDLGKLLRGGAAILDRNAPRLQALANQAGMTG